MYARFILIASLIAFMMTSQASAKVRQDPLVACVLSLLLPGAGQAYNQQYGKGVIQLGSVVTGLMLIHLANEDNGYRYNFWSGRTDRVDIDGDDGLAVAGVGLWLAGHLWSIIDAPLSAKKINRQRQFGHLIEFEGNQTTLGIDPVASRNRLGTMLTLRFQSF